MTGTIGMTRNHRNDGEHPCAGMMGIPDYLTGTSGRLTGKAARLPGNGCEPSLAVLYWPCREEGSDKASGQGVAGTGRLLPLK